VIGGGVGGEGGQQQAAFNATDTARQAKGASCTRLDGGWAPLLGAEHLDAASVARAEKDGALQLSRGVRLAAVLNKALGRQVADKQQR
jgi:hypothetical protein